MMRVKSGSGMDFNGFKVVVAVLLAAGLLAAHVATTSPLDYFACQSQTPGPDLIRCCDGVFEGYEQRCFNQTKPSAAALQGEGCYEPPTWPQQEWSCAHQDNWPEAYFWLYSQCEEADVAGYQSCVTGGGGVG